MKKHLLFLAALVLGLGQLFADEVTFSVSDLKATLPASNTNIDLPYAWKTSPYHVTATIEKTDGTTGTLGVSTVIALNANYKVTVSVAGAGTLNSIKFTTNPASQNANATASTGTFASGTWTPEGATSSVTFTATNNFRLTQIVVTYTPDSGYTPDVPATATMGDPIEAIAIDNIDSYTGSEPYVYNKANMTYYALNNLGQYEEYGIFTEVNTLKVAGGGVTEIEYIATTESDGKHPYINTNYIPKANTRIVMDVNIENSTAKDWMAVFGARQNGWTSHAFVLFARAWGNQKGCFNRTGDEHAAESEIPRNQRMTIDALGKTCSFTLAGASEPALTITTSESSSVQDCTNNLFIFDTNTGGANENRRDNSFVYMKLYGCQIYEGETLVKDFVPIVDSEGNGGLKDKVTGEIILSASSDNFVLSADGQAIASSAGISVYEGKRVKLTTDNHEYKYQNSQWLDCGAMALEEITDTDPSYKDMRNWKTNDSHMSIFSGFTYDGTTNVINPYVGTGGHEPYMFQIPTLAGQDYNWSFIYSGSAYDSWHSTEFHAYVANDYNLNTTETGASYNNNVIGIAEAFPFAGVENKSYSIDFTAKQSNETLVVQFGDANDDKEFWFKFANLKVSKYIYPLAYEEIDFVAQDDNKYTPLEYIESTGAVRENAFTTTYIAKASTEVDIKFHTYNPGNGDWRAIFSGRNGSDAGNGISLYKNGGADKFGYFVGGYRNDNFADFPGFDQDITVEASLSGLVVNGGEKVNTNQTSFSSSTRGISMFANPEWDAPFRGRIYYMTIKEDGTTIYDFQPVMRHDGAFGYYDRKTATFVQPAKGNWNGYGYKKLDDQAYITYTDETRIVMVGSTAQFLPDVQNLDGATFTWTSADETIATVAADGTVTGVKAGKVMITVTTDADQGWTASYELTVSEPNYVRKDVNGVGYAIVTGGNGWGDSPVANLVDNDATTKFGCSGAGDAWAIIIASEPVAVQQYSFVTGGDTYGNPGRTPRNWKLEGSNDNQTWTVIDQQEQNYKAKTANKEQTVFTVNGTDTYKFFKFTAGNFNGGFQLGELWINEQAHTWGEPTETASTCTVEGKKVWECTDCKVLKTERLPLAAHTYENNVCTVCNANVAEPILLANGQANDYIVKFRHKTGENNPEEIEAGWANANFDDSAWDELVMPIGTAGYGVQHTIWQNDYNTFWFRRNFNVENPAAITKLTLKLLHDDCCAVYLNGNVIRENPEGNDWTNGTEWLELNVDPSLLVAGNNVVAVYIEQNWGGAYCDFYLEGKAGATITVSDAGYATFVAPCDVDFNGSAATPKAAKFDGKYVQLTDVTKVPAGTAVVVKADAGTYTVPATTDAALGAPNELIAATADVTADGTQYILAKEAEGVGFYKATTGSTIKAGKGYLEISAPVKPFYPFGEDGATGINGVDMNASNAPIYNVAGQRISKMQKGINIIGGKKVLK